MFRVRAAPDVLTVDRERGGRGRALPARRRGDEEARPVGPQLANRPTVLP